MKTTILFSLFIFTALRLLSQSDFSRTLEQNEKFVRISKNQLMDSVNMNQTGPEQFEYFEISLNEKDTAGIHDFMHSCRKIQSIIDRYGSPGIDVCMWSSSNIKRPISGYFYSVGCIDLIKGPQLVLKILYPRFDNPPATSTRL